MQKEKERWVLRNGPWGLTCASYCTPSLLLHLRGLRSSVTVLVLEYFLRHIGYAGTRLGSAQVTNPTPLANWGTSHKLS